MRSREFNIVLLNIVSFAVLLIVVIVNIVVWQTNYAGYNINIVTREITAVESGTAAESAGVQVGDRVVGVYNIRWNDLVHHWNVLSLKEAWNPSIPLEVERGGVLKTLHITRQPPTLSLQLFKARFIILSILCWLIGYTISTVRRHEAVGSSIVPFFWFVTSLICGIYVFTIEASWPLYTIIMWIVVTVLAPLIVYVHIWFPPRQVLAEFIHKARKVLIVSVVVFNIALAVYVIATGLNLPETIIVLTDTLVPFAFCCCLVFSSALLYGAYKRSIIAHTRRQIRIIAISFVLVVIIRLFLFFVSDIIKLEVSAFEGMNVVITTLIPLSYFFVGLFPNLRNIDRLAIRIFALLCSTVAIIASIMVVGSFISIQTTNILLYCTFGLLIFGNYTYKFLVRLFASNDRSSRLYSAFSSATLELATSLDPNTLIQILRKAIAIVFHNPAFAFYTVPNDTSQLRLACQYNLSSLPEVIERGTLTNALLHQDVVIEAHVLQTKSVSTSLLPTEQAAVYCPGIALWCPILHAEGSLLGIMLIGADPNLDQYYRQDFDELRRFVNASSLAFANSAAYQRQCEAEETIKHLYISLQQTQDEIASDLAREIHDEVINISLRLNIQSLEKLLTIVKDPFIHEELFELLKSEHSVSNTLRTICEQLYPSGIVDELGLASVLRQHVERIQNIWSGQCHFTIKGAIMPVAVHQQREVLRIVKEAIANAMKHALATTITVILQFPSNSNEQLVLAIQDNGRSNHAIAPKQGHWGIRYMKESARIAKGTVTFQREVDGGTLVTFTFPAT